MNILVTGAKGFIGKNLVAELKNHGYNNIFEYDLDTDRVFLDAYTGECDFVFHLAGVNRPEDENEFDIVHRGFTSELLAFLTKHKNDCPIAVSSSIQAVQDNPYGASKKACEDEIFAYAKTSGAKVLVYRLPNVFGKWCRPNYNSAVATFCFNITNDLAIKLNPADPELTLCYIDDLLEEFISSLNGHEHRYDDGFCYVPVTHTIRLHKIAELIQSFHASRENYSVPEISDPFTKKLYSTYLSYLPRDKFSYPLKMNMDYRGSFTEFLKTPDRGQVSINISKPGITKGNHWHHTKNEKFLVVSGQGKIQFRHVHSDEIIEYAVSGEKLEVIDIPPGYTHNIINTGEDDLVTVMWANEIFNPEKPDTFYLEV